MNPIFLLILCLSLFFSYQDIFAGEEILLPQADGSQQKLNGAGKAAQVAPGGLQKNYISTATTTQVKTGAGFLHCITVNTTAAGTITIIDGTSGTTANIGVMKASIAEGSYCHDVPFTTGLRIITAAASDLTVSYW